MPDIHKKTCKEYWVSQSYLSATPPTFKHCTGSENMAQTKENISSPFGVPSRKLFQVSPDFWLASWGTVETNAQSAGCHMGGRQESYRLQSIFQLLLQEKESRRMHKQQNWQTNAHPTLHITPVFWCSFLFLVCSVSQSPVLVATCIEGTPDVQVLQFFACFIGRNNAAQWIRLIINASLCCVLFVFLNAYTVQEGQTMAFLIPRDQIDVVVHGVHLGSERHTLAFRFLPRCHPNIWKTGKILCFYAKLRGSWCCLVFCCVSGPMLSSTNWLDAADIGPERNRLLMWLS